VRYPFQYPTDKVFLRKGFNFTILLVQGFFGQKFVPHNFKLKANSKEREKKE